MKDLRALAFYLPQFHPIPENNAWWGPGFTEWRNVAKAQPRFPGHEQPHLPADLGFYDLRLADSRLAQADLARAHGIHGFCYYHYWFNGRRLLREPIDRVLESGQPDFPFCLCWANENWTRAWDGKTRDVLIGQHYSDNDDRAHLRWLAPAFADPRYVRIDGKPVFLLYRASQLPDPRRTTDIWREEAGRLGLGELYLCRVECFRGEQTDPASLGFDAAVEFQPDWAIARQPLRRSPWWTWATRLGLSPEVYQSSRVFSYPALVEAALAKPPPGYQRFPGVTPMWDNSARRREGATIFTGSTPELYEQWLRETAARFDPRSPQENLLFINAWNEWAEGNHLEPDQRRGRAYLEATGRALAPASTSAAPAR